ncbi:B12-binding domain-containing radical SAM protein, partial [Candidatus Omnitrophota bacterium]
MEILLINLPPWGIEVPSLGTACLSSYLRSRGIATEIFDLNIELYNKIPKDDKFLWSMPYSTWWVRRKEFSEVYSKIKSYLDQLIDVIVNSSAPILGFSLSTDCSDLILKDIVKKVKQKDPSKIIILGGVSIGIKEQRVALLPEIKDYIDFCVVGEGEVPLYTVLSAILKNKEVPCIEGVLKKDDFFNNIDSGRGEELDSLPYPTFEEFNLDNYAAPNCILMEFSRGCISHCPFCSFKKVLRFFKSKSASNIFE